MSDENEIYQKWLGTPEAERADVAAELSGLVERHAKAVVWQKLNENNPELVQNIVAAVLAGLQDFRQESKFSTWVHAVAVRQVYADLRKRRRYRAVFDETTVVVTDPPEEPDNRVREGVPTTLPDLDGPIAFAEFSDGLSEEDAVLLGHKRTGFSSKEVAGFMGTTVEAIDSRWARLKPKLENEFHSERRKHRVSGN